MEISVHSAADIYQLLTLEGEILTRAISENQNAGIVKCVIFLNNNNDNNNKFDNILISRIFIEITITKTITYFNRKMVRAHEQELFLLNYN